MWLWIPNKYQCRDEDMKLVYLKFSTVQVKEGYENGVGNVYLLNGRKFSDRLIIFLFDTNKISRHIKIYR